MRRCKAGYNEPCSTSRTSSEFRSMALAMACPWAGPESSVRRIRRSRVPCRSSIRSCSSLVDILGEGYAGSSRMSRGVPAKTVCLRRAVSLLGEELQDGGVRGGGLIGGEQVISRRDDHEAGAGDARCDQLTIAGGHQPVVGAVDYQSGRSDLRQPVVGLPRKDALQLRRVAFDGGIAGTALGQIFVHDGPRRTGVVQER